MSVEPTTKPAAAAGTVALGDLTVNRMGFGAMRLTGAGVWGEPPDRDGAKQVLRRAVELGVNLIDTADAYGPDVNEALIAETLHSYPDGLVIATKGGLTRPGPGRWVRDCRPETLRSSLDGSLRRLRLDRIDLYQLHTVDPAVPLEDSMGTLVELQQEGKIRHIGLSNVDARELATATGRLADVARARGATCAQVALAWLLRRSPVMAPIPGTSSVEHLEEDIAATGVELSDAEFAELSRSAEAVL